MALNELMTVFEIHNNNLHNLCVPDGHVAVYFGYVTLRRLREAYPDRKWYG